MERVVVHNVPRRRRRIGEFGKPFDTVGFEFGRAVGVGADEKRTRRGDIVPYVGAFLLSFVVAFVVALFFALFFALSPGGVDTFTEGDKVVSLGLGAVFPVEA